MCAYTTKKNILARTSLAVLAAISIWLALGVLFPHTAEVYGGGDGSKENPYQISAIADLEQVRTDAAGGETGGRYYRLMNNLDLSGLNWTPIGAEASLPFRGHFDGGGHTISNLTIGTQASPDATLDYPGLFGYTDGASIHHLNLEDAAIYSSKQYAKAGALVGYANGGIMEYCSATGSVSGGEDAAAGGLAGYIDGATVRDSHTDVSVEEKSIGVVSDYLYAGGLVGYSHQGTIERSYTSGSVEAGYFTSGSGWVHYYYVGGLVGYNDGGVIKNSYSSGTVLGGQGPNAADRANVGGLAGAHNNGGSIINCYATGNVGITSGAIWYTGGLTGENNGGSIQNSYASCRITPGGYGNGGLIGHYFGGAITNSYWNSNIGTATKGIGYNETGTDTTIAKTSAEMQTSGFFRLLNKNRGSNARWKIIPGVNGGYPVLLDIGQGVDRSGYTDWYYDDPEAAEFTVSTAAELAYFAELVNTGTNFSGKTVNLAAAIDLGADINSEEWQPIGDASGSPFRGTFDGHNHAISNLKIGTSASPDASLNYAGLFGYFQGTAIRNVDVDAAIYSSWGYGYIGGLVGRNNGGAIENCHMTGSLTGGNDAFVGGLTGYNSGTIGNGHAAGNVTGGNGAQTGGITGNNTGAIEESHATGNVTGSNGVCAGGLAGFNSGGIHNCYATGSVLGNNYAAAGGLAGYNTGTIEGSYATGDVTAGNGNETGAGGLVGYNREGTIKKSHAAGAVTVGDDTDRLLYAGGLVGLAYRSIIEDSYAEGSVTGGYGVRAGGLVGYLSSGYSITNCYARGNVTGGNSAYVGGLAGYFQGTLTNCYATGDAAGGSGSYVGGLLGRRSGGTFTYGYWNSDAAQTVNGAAQEPKKGVGYGTDASTAKTSGEMQSEAFVTLLNDHRGEHAQWMIVPGQNDGYPVLNLTEPPAAPTNPVTDDVNNTFGWTNVTGFDNVSDYEYTKDGGTTWNTCDANPQTGFDGDIAADQVRVRVKADASSGRPAGAELQATEAFTANPVASIASTIPASLTEAAANNGSLDPNTVVITIADGRLANPLVKEDITASNLPVGLDYTVTRDSDTRLTVTITGHAASHAAADSINNLTFTIARARVTGAEGDLTTENITINFTDPTRTAWSIEPIRPNLAPRIASTRPDRLNEGAANNGSLASGTVVITIADGILAADIAKEDVIAANLPAGLDFTVTRTDDTHLAITITGRSLRHSAADSVHNLTFTIAKAKISGATADLTTAKISIVFTDPAAPAAPVNPVVNETGNSFSWNYAPGFDSPSDYEYSLDGGATWTGGTENPRQLDGDGYTAGEAQVRVQAGGTAGKPEGQVLAAATLLGEPRVYLLPALLAVMALAAVITLLCRKKAFQFKS